MEKMLDLSKLVSPPDTDAIFGRHNGTKYAETHHLIDELSKDVNFVIKIDSDKVKSINDSFIKGMFRDIFKKYKNIESVSKHFLIEADEPYKALFYKNWAILEAINNLS